MSDMILTQAVIQLFFLQDCATIQNAKIGEKKIAKLYQVICTLDTIYMPNIMSSSGSPDILFIRFRRFTMRKSKKGHNSAMTSTTEKKKKYGSAFFMHIPYINFQDPTSNHS